MSVSPIDSTETIPPVLQSVEDDGVCIVNPGTVSAFVANHGDLIELLPRLCAAVRTEFGSDAQLVLKLYSDPEFQDSYLTLYVRPTSYDDGLMGRIDRVSQEIDLGDAPILVTTDFRPPTVTDGV